MMTTYPYQLMLINFQMRNYNIPFASYFTLWSCLLMLYLIHLHVHICMHMHSPRQCNHYACDNMHAHVLNCMCTCTGTSCGWFLWWPKRILSVVHIDHDAWTPLPTFILLWCTYMQQATYQNSFVHQKLNVGRGVHASDKRTLGKVHASGNTHWGKLTRRENKRQERFTHQ